MTEDEAKTKWCPIRPRGHYANRATNGAVRDDLSCIGSPCMAWRATDNECTNPKQDMNTTAGRSPTS